MWHAVMPPNLLRNISDYFNDKSQTLCICFIGNIETVTRMGGKKAEFAQIKEDYITKEDFFREQNENRRIFTSETHRK